MLFAESGMFFKGPSKRERKKAKKSDSSESGSDSKTSDESDESSRIDLALIFLVSGTTNMPLAKCALCINTAKFGNGSRNEVVVLAASPAWRFRGAPLSKS
jgi:hypothetical protein